MTAKRTCLGFRQVCWDDDGAAYPGVLNNTDAIPLVAPASFVTAVTDRMGLFPSKLRCMSPNDSGSASSHAHFTVTDVPLSILFGKSMVMSAREGQTKAEAT